MHAGAAGVLVSIYAGMATGACTCGLWKIYAVRIPPPEQLHAGKKGRRPACLLLLLATGDIWPNGKMHPGLTRDGGGGGVTVTAGPVNFVERQCTPVLSPALGLGYTRMFFFFVKSGILITISNLQSSGKNRLSAKGRGIKRRAQTEAW